MYGRKQRRGNFLKTGIKECVWVDYKSVDELRRLMTIQVIRIPVCIVVVIVIIVVVAAAPRLLLLWTF